MYLLVQIFAISVIILPQLQTVLLLQHRKVRYLLHYPHTFNKSGSVFRFLQIVHTYRRGLQRITRLQRDAASALGMQHHRWHVYQFRLFRIRRIFVSVRLARVGTAGHETVEEQLDVWVETAWIGVFRVQPGGELGQSWKMEQIAFWIRRNGIDGGLLQFWLC